MLLLDLLAFPFLFGAGAAIAWPIFYAPIYWGERFVVWTEQHLGLPLSETMNALMSEMGLAVLLINWACYTALGFLLGLLVGRLIWRTPGRREHRP